MAAYGAKEPLRAIREFARAVVRSALGKIDLNTIFENRNQINKEVTETMAEGVERWGATILRFAVVSIDPSDKNVASSLHKQAAAEREKTETILHAEASKEALMKQSDANLYTIKKNADAYEYKQMMEGDGDKTKIIRKAEAEQESIALIAKALEIEGGK